MVGNPSKHGQHNDMMFGNTGVYFVILFIWIWSFASISFDAFDPINHYKWSNTMYGCDGYTGFDNHTSFGSITNIVVNLLIIFVSYAIVARRLTLDQKEIIKSPKSQHVNDMFTKHLKMLFSLSIAYTICVIPVTVLGWGMFGYLVDHHIDQEVRNTLQAISSCLYWSMYGEFLTLVIHNCLSILFDIS